LTAACLFVAGVLQATLGADAFTIAWRHSVTHTRWQEDYRVAGGRIVAVESRIEGSGAGMDPPPDARFADGMWRWRPALPPLAALHLTVSPYTEDYRLCARGHCTPLHALVRAPADRIEVVDVRACPAASRMPGERAH